jgi:enterochelin esterase-like enzyme
MEWVHNISQHVKASFRSEALQKEMELTVYLPAGFRKDHSYPVLYLLHGFSGDKYSMLLQYGMEEALDRLIGSGQLPPMLVAAPGYDGSYGVNSARQTRIWSRNADGSKPRYEGRYEDFLTGELIRFVESHFPAHSGREHRFIGGFSMGGFAGLHLAFRHPGLYSRVGAIGAALQRPGNNPTVYRWLYPTPELQMERDPLLLAFSRDLGSLRVYLDCGREDPFLPANTELAGILRSRGVSVAFAVRPGGHTADYVRREAESFLQFFG